MLLLCFKRTFHSSIQRLVQTEKSLLAKLRKKTGYPISNCKKALEAHNNNLEEALKYLHEQAQKEGWAKAQKLQGRKTGQGLIGILVKNRVAAMVEVNCETDFVSRNKEFQNLVKTVSQICNNHAGTLEKDGHSLTKVNLDGGQLLSMAWKESGEKLSDLLALKIGLVGENLSLRRAVCLAVDDPLHIGSRVHPSDEPDVQPESYSCGTYGALTVFSKSDDDAAEAIDSKLSLVQCGRQLSLHVIGMSPEVVGDISEEPLPNIENETRMVHQEFLPDSTLTVGNFLQYNNLRVVDFVRYGCGEDLEDADRTSEIVNKVSDLQ